MITKDFANTGIATFASGGIEFKNVSDISCDEFVKHDRHKIDWGNVVLYGLAALCFMAIGALIGLWTLVM